MEVERDQPLRIPLRKEAADHQAIVATGDTMESGPANVGMTDLKMGDTAKVRTGTKITARANPAIKCQLTLLKVSVKPAYQ